jgi:hypothetical protein
MMTWWRGRKKVKGKICAYPRAYLHVNGLIKAVHLIEKFQQDPLDLSICAGLRVKTLRRNRIDLINKDDTRGILLGQSKDVPHHPGPFTQVLLHELGPVHPDKGGTRVMGDGLDEHRLARARRPVQEDAPGRVDANLLVKLQVCQGQFDRFPDFLLLDIETANVRVRHVRLLHVSEKGDRGVRLWG